MAPSAATYKAFISILERDSKDTTYKFALLRALAEVAEQDDQHRITGNEHWVEFPMGLLVERWLRYYFPLLAKEYPQRNGGGRIAFGSDFGALIDLYPHGVGYQQFLADMRRNEVPASVAPALWRLSGNIAGTIARYPMKHLGFSYFKEHYQVARPCRRGRVRRLKEFNLPLLREVLGTFELRTDFYELFRDMAGFLIGKQAVLYQWADFVSEADDKSPVKVEAVLSALGHDVRLERDVQAARKAYAGVLGAGGLECVWSGRPIREPKRLHVDHAIPFRWWGINDLWNLMPADSAVNAKKSEAIPSPALIERRAHVIQANWQVLRRSNPIQFDAQLRGSLVGDRAVEADWAEQGIAAMIAKAEYLIDRRGCEAWEV